MNSTEQIIISTDFTSDYKTYLEMWNNQLSLITKYERRKPIAFIIMSAVLILVTASSLLLIDFEFDNFLVRITLITLILSVIFLISNIIALCILRSKRLKIEFKISKLCAKTPDKCLHFNYKFYLNRIVEDSSLQSGVFVWQDFKVIRLNRNFLYLRFKSKIKRDSNYQISDILIPLHQVESKDYLYELLFKEAMGSGVKVYFDYY